jgi:putative ABC transport system ATP-binding protein
VAIARAVAGAPPSSSPTSPPPASTRVGDAGDRALKDLARERGHTVVVVTHDNRIFHLADRIVSASKTDAS